MVVRGRCLLAVHGVLHTRSCVRQQRPRPQVAASSSKAVAPSSIRLWEQVLRNKDSVYLGDFDTAFANQFFWSWKDTGAFGYSTASIARAGVLLAYSLQALASGSTVRSQANATVRSGQS